MTAENVVIAVGTNPARPSGVDFDDRRVIDSDGVMELDYSYCKTMTIVGGGVIGVEYASMFAAMGVRVTLVDARERLLPYVDRDIAVALQYLLRRRNMTFRFGEEVVGVERKQDRVVCYMRSGKQIATHTLLYATGRQGATAGLSLANAGLECDKRGRIDVDAEYRTAVPHVFAVGDVAGPPGLAATSMEQGRIASLAAFGEPVTHLPELVPTGIYSIPEISFVGRTEEDLTAAAVPYVVGVAWWRELAKAMMMREEDGLLKILVSPEDRRLLGVHVIGAQATDLVHIGQALMDRENGLDFLVSTVFNYPTLAEAYKVAGLGRDEPDRDPATCAVRPEPAAVLTAQAASSSRNGSIGSRNRGVSTLTNTIVSAYRIGSDHSHGGARRAAFVHRPRDRQRAQHPERDHADLGIRFDAARSRVPTGARRSCRAARTSAAGSTRRRPAARSDGVRCSAAPATRADPRAAPPSRERPGA